MFRDNTAEWSGGPVEADDEPETALERIVLTRSRPDAEVTVLLVEVHRDLFGAYVVTRCASSSRRPIAVLCQSLDEAMVEAGGLIHGALSSGYHVAKETAFSS